MNMNTIKSNQANNRKPNWKLALSASLLFAVLTPFSVSALDSRAAFKFNKVGQVMKQIAGKQSISQSGKIKIVIPEIAEIGSEVGVRVLAHGLNNVESITLIAEKNDNPMLASFKIPVGTDPFIKSRVKLRQSTKVIALVKADGKFYTASKVVKITIGGCGGGSSK